MNGPSEFPGGRRFEFSDPSGNELGAGSTEVSLGPYKSITDAGSSSAGRGGHGAANRGRNIEPVS